MKLQYIGTTTKYDVTVMAVASNVMEVDGTLPMKEKGFKLIDERKGKEYDYSAYKTLYRTVTGGYQYSNDGSTWDEPTKDVDVMVMWRDDENVEGMRPEEVTLTVKDGDTVVEEITLSEADEWKKTYHGVPVSHEYSVEGEEVENYNFEATGTMAVYSLIAPEAPTIEEQLAEITDFIMQLDERVYILEGGE